MNKSLKILALFASVFLLFACSGKKQELKQKQKLLNWNIGSSGPKTLDPGLAGASDAGDVINNVYEGLVRERSGVVSPGIAESWDISDDGLVYTFYLRDNLKWSDGSPLTAKDIEYSWLRVMDATTASEYIWIWKYTNVKNAYEFGNPDKYPNVKREDVGVKALDDKTFQVTLNKPTDYFLAMTAFYSFKPVKQSVVENPDGIEGTWAKNPKLAISNGAYKLTYYKDGDKLILEKNPYYWNKDVVKIDVINGFFIDDDNTSYTAYKNGDLDFIPSVPTAEIPKLIAESDEFYIFPLLGTYYYNFNLDSSKNNAEYNKAIQNPLVRKALAYAIDRKTIVDTLGTGNIVATGFVPQGMKDNQGRDFAQIAGNYDIPTDSSKFVEAKKLLSQAGYPDGKGFPQLEILYNTNDGHKTVAELIQEMWKVNLGIKVTLKNQEWAVFQSTRTAGDFSISRGGWLTDYIDPSGLLGIFTKGNAYNDAHYDNPKFDAAMSKATETSSKKEHFNQLYKAQEILMKDLPVIPIYYYTENMLVSDSVVNWDRSVLGAVDFTQADIERKVD